MRNKFLIESFTDDIDILCLTETHMRRYLMKIWWLIILTSCSGEIEIYFVEV